MEDKLSGRVYLDHAATSCVMPHVSEAMGDALRAWANPSSPHAEGRAAQKLLEQSRTAIARSLGWGGEIIFTSGASEALSITIARRRGAGKLFYSAVEHDAVRRPAREINGVEIPVGSDGRVDLDKLAEMIAGSGESPLVAVQHVNSETGVIQPLAEINKAVKSAGGLLLADCAQSAGRLALPEADMIVLSAHKFGGPPGVGALLVRELGLLQPSGGQERGYRAGTENLPGITGMAAALAEGPASAKERAAWLAKMVDLRAWLDERICAAGGTLVCAKSERSPLVASYAMPSVTALAQMMQFDTQGFAVSTGSACSSGSMKPSHVIKALGLSPDISDKLIRVSFGWSTTHTEVEAFADAWQNVADRARQMQQQQQ